MKTKANFELLNKLINFSTRSHALITEFRTELTNNNRSLFLLGEKAKVSYGQVQDFALIFRFERQDKKCGLADKNKCHKHAGRKVIGS